MCVITRQVSVQVFKSQNGQTFVLNTVYPTLGLINFNFKRWIYTNEEIEDQLNVKHLL